MQETFVQCELVRDVYDTARDQTQRRQQEVEAAKAAAQAAEQSATRRDFLASYLPESVRAGSVQSRTWLTGSNTTQYSGASLSYDDALKVRDTYMEALRHKLQAKSTIIQQRLRSVRCRNSVLYATNTKF
jgi:hypothetical protein